MTKTLLREQILNKRLNLSPGLISEASGKVAENLETSDLLKGSHKILPYLALGNEVDTVKIIKYLVNHRKTLFLPCYVNNEWAICRYDPNEPLIKIFRDVMQPKKLELSNLEILDAAIVPGVAFSKNGARMGFGLGVYDKLLAGSHAKKVGLCYDFQIVDELAAEPHDVLMDYVVSESGIIKAT